MEVEEGEEQFAAAAVDVFTMRSVDTKARGRWEEEKNCGGVRGVRQPYDRERGVVQLYCCHG